MQNIYNILKNTTLAIFAAVLATACSLEKADVMKGLQSVIIEIEVSAEDIVTRSTEAPEASEQAINTLRIYAFRGDRLCGYYNQTEAYSSPVLMDLELPDGISAVDFYLVANEAAMEYKNDPVVLREDMTRAELESLRFTALAGKTSLPMYCRKTENIDASDLNTAYTPSDYHKGHLKLNQQVQFELTRSLAKLSVYAAKAQGVTADPHILQVDILSQGTREYSYLFPQSEEVLDAVPSRANDWQLISEEVVVSKSVASSDDPADYDPVALGNYLPEVSAGYGYDDPSYSWSATSSDTGAAVLYVKYSSGENTDIRHGYINLPRIERNNHLKVCILINAEGQITVNYTVADWYYDQERNENEWYFDYPTHSYLREDIPYSTEDLASKPSSAAVMSSTSYFEGYFQMTYPDNDKWMPTLEGDYASDCQVLVYDSNGNEVFGPSGRQPLGVSDKWYKIVVQPNNTMPAGKTVNLAVTYTPSGFDQPEYLLINGSHDNFYWPGSEDENYVTITMVN